MNLGDRAADRLAFASDHKSSIFALLPKLTPHRMPDRDPFDQSPCTRPHVHADKCTCEVLLDSTKVINAYKREAAQAAVCAEPRYIHKKRRVDRPQLLPKDPDTLHMSK